jgi:hypothetical protein
MSETVRTASDGPRRTPGVRFARRSKCSSPPDCETHLVKEFERLPSGLYVPGQQREEDSPGLQQQIAIRLSTAELGLERLTLGELRAEAARIPFEPGFVGLGMIANRLHDISRDGVAQLELLQEIYGQVPITERYERALERYPGAIVMSQQQIFIAQRLLVDHARDASVDSIEITNAEAVSLSTLLVHSLDLIDASHPRLLQGEVGIMELIAYIVQAAAYDSRRALVNEYGRSYDVFFTRARELIDERVPLDQWALEDVGLSLEEQLSGGFGYHAMSTLPDSKTGRVPAQIQPTVLVDSAIASIEDRVVSAISAPRAWFRERFARGDQSVRDVVWEIAPFSRRPFIQLESGNLALTSPTALVEWLTFGMYDRLRESAKERRTLTKKFDTLSLFGATYGDLTEDYCLAVCKSVHPQGRVYGDQPYGKGGGKRTPDIAIISGSDLILIEVRSGYLSPWLRTSGDRREFEDQLDKLVFKKLAQLGRAIADLKSGVAVVGDVDIEDVTRIWPVLITASMLLSEPLWQVIEASLPAPLQEPDVQPLVVGDIEDLELMMGLVEKGHDLIEILAARAETPYAKLEIKRWVLDEMKEDSTIRPALVLENWARAQRAMTMTLWPHQAEPVEGTSPTS